MKKILLSLFVAVTAAFAANAQTNLVKNGDFETWADNLPTHWKSASKASTATLSQSTVFHGGQYSVKVEGHASQNKRLAYEEITLKKGTYKISFQVRGEADGASCRPGYVPVKDGVAVSSGYTYGQYVNDIKSTEWTAVNHEFTLEKQTTLCLVVMNPKNKGNLLIDDFSLTTTDGGIVEEDNPQPQPQPEPGEVVYFKALTDNDEGWTYNQGTLPEGFTAIWVQDAKYGIKATAYDGKTKVKHAAEAWAISPAIVLKGKSILTFDQAQRFFGDVTKENTLWVREGSGEWQQLTIPTYSDGTSWKYVASGDIDLSAFVGKTVQFGFKYTSSTEAASTWEVKNVKVRVQPTAIEKAETRKGADVIFDLSGRRVQKAENGIFIINGVKRVVK